MGAIDRYRIKFCKLSPSGSSGLMMTLKQLAMPIGSDWILNKFA